MPESFSIAHFDNARRSLQLATTIDEVMDIRDKAEALRAYAKQSGQTHEMQNHIAEIKVRAERKAGELLLEIDMHEGGKPNRFHAGTGKLKLEDIGITKSQSHRYQTLASIPEPEFDTHIAVTKAKGAEVTSAGLYKMGRQKVAQEKADEQPIHEDCTDNLQDYIDSGVKFSTIYADPAWKYGNQATRASTDNHYLTMTVDEICALPVKQLVTDDAHLHLWTTNAFLFEAKRVMEEWGFEYKSVMVWVKPQLGIGNYWRVSHEFLLFGIRGKSPFRDRSIKSWQEVERAAHSAKPELFRKLIERASPGPYLEMFARTAPHGWSAWGNQIQGRDMYEG